MGPGALDGPRSWPQTNSGAGPERMRYPDRPLSRPATSSPSSQPADTEAWSLQISPWLLRASASRTSTSSVRRADADSRAGIPFARAVIILFGLLTIFWLLTASPALAARGHVFSKSFAEEGSGPGQLKEPGGLAVNEATGDIYVADKGNNRVEYFSSAGAFEGEFTGTKATGTGTLSAATGTGTTTSGSEILTGVVTSTGAFAVGQSISGTGIPANATISALGAGTLTLSAAAEASGTAVELRAGSTLITSVIREAGPFTVGQEVSAPGLPAGTTILAVKEGGAVLEVSAPATAAELLATLTAHQSFSEPEGVAVDNSCRQHKPEPLTEATTPKCAEADPSNGDVYVLDFAHNVIDKFTASGEYVAQITHADPEHPFNQYFGIAVNPQGDPWTSESQETAYDCTNPGICRATQYSDAVVPVLVKGSIQQPNPVNTPMNGFPHSGLAVDSQDDLYIIHENPHVVAKFDSTGRLLSEALDLQASSGVSVEAGTDGVYVDNLSVLSRFNRRTEPLEELKLPGAAPRATGVAVDSSRESVLVADAATGRVDVYGPEPAGAPAVLSEDFSELTAGSVTLTATLDPHGAASEYRFEYGPCSAPASCESSPYILLPAGSAGSDFEHHTFSVHLQTLTVGTPYHFRVSVLRGGHLEQSGAEETFTTQAAGTTAALPDARAWEMVSQPNKHGADLEPSNAPGVIQAAADGGAFAYFASAPTEPQVNGFDNGTQVFSVRTPGGWLTRDLTIPHPEPTGVGGSKGREYRVFSSDLSLSVLQPFGAFAALSPEASEQTAYLHEDFAGPGAAGVCESSCFSPLVTGRPGVANVPPGVRFGEEGHCPALETVCGPRFQGGSPDLRHLVLGSTSGLTPGTTGGLYEWSGGTLSFIGQGELGYKDASVRHAVSDDGSRVVFSNAGGLFVRDVSLGQTVRVDVVQAGASGSGPEQPEFQIASADGSRVFFTDSQQLTVGSGASEGSPDLYECVVVVTGGVLGCDLSDVTPEAGGSGPGDVLGGVLGASEDGSWVYFAANGALAAGAPHGSCPQTRKVSSGVCGLFVWHEGVTRLVAVLSGEDQPDWEATLSHQPARVTPDGGWFAFMSKQRLPTAHDPAGYDNRDAFSGIQDEEVFLYHAPSAELVCASCNPTGSRPVGAPYGSGVTPRLVTGDRVWSENRWLAANIPGWTSFELEKSFTQPHYLFDNGRLFFNSSDALVPQDVNATQDVYQYEPPGVGSCTTASVTYSEHSKGCVDLVSSGTSSEESAFLDASETGGRDAEGHEGGGDVFFLTAAQLSKKDTDSSLDVYDAHECSTAAPCPSEVASPPPCATEASCKASPAVQPPIYGPPASATFSGAGNLTPTAPPPAKPTAAQERAKKLAVALKLCRKKHNKHKRAVCEKSAHKKYAKKATAKKSTRKGHR